MNDASIPPPLPDLPQRPIPGGGAGGRLPHRKTAVDGRRLLAKWRKYLATTGCSHFFSLTGGSILYCLSALSILYGVAQISQPVLVQIDKLADTLWCLLALNVYELTLLGVVTLIVVWKNVTDDAISLIVLIALFLIATGIVLSAVSPDGSGTCLIMGFLCSLLGLIKLVALRKSVGLPLSSLSLFGLLTILIWNFTATPYLGYHFVDSQVQHRDWLLASIVLLTGIFAVLVDAIRTRHPKRNEPRSAAVFIRRPAMVWLFSLIIVSAASIHLYTDAYLFSLHQYLGDYLPLITLGVLLSVEFLRSLGKRFGALEIAFTIIPFALINLAVATGAFHATTGIGFTLLWHPAVLCALTGILIMVQSIRHQWPLFRSVALAYFLESLLFVGYAPSHGPPLNWHLFLYGLAVLILMTGILRKQFHLCTASVVLFAFNTGTLDGAMALTRSWDLTVLGTIAGMAGLGTILCCLMFHPKTPYLKRSLLAGTILWTIFLFDVMPKAPHVADLGILACIAGLGTLILWRRKVYWPILIMSVPMIRDIHFLVTRMASWGYIVLSFVLLFLGLAASLFLKKNNAADAGDPAG